MANPSRSILTPPRRRRQRPSAASGRLYELLVRCGRANRTRPKCDHVVDCQLATTLFISAITSPLQRPCSYRRAAGRCRSRSLPATLEHRRGPSVPVHRRIPARDHLAPPPWASTCRFARLRRHRARRIRFDCGVRPPRRCPDSMMMRLQIGSVTSRLASRMPPPPTKLFGSSGASRPPSARGCSWRAVSLACELLIGHRFGDFDHGRGARPDAVALYLLHRTSGSAEIGGHVRRGWGSPPRRGRQMADTAQAAHPAAAVELHSGIGDRPGPSAAGRSWPISATVCWILLPGTVEHLLLSADLAFGVTR